MTNKLEDSMLKKATLKLKRILLNSETQEMSIFKYTKNKIEVTPYICATTKKEIYRLYTTSKYVHEFENTKIFEAKELLYRVLDAYVEPYVLCKISFRDVYLKEIVTMIVEEFYSEEVVYSSIKEKNDLIDKLQGTFNYCQAIQEDLQAVYLLYKENKKSYKKKDYNIETTVHYRDLIEEIIKSVYIRGYTS